MEAPVSAQNEDAAEPAIAADADGNIYVVYVEHGANKAADVYLQKFSSDAKSIGERVRINSDAGQATAWRGDPPTIKLGKDQTVYVGWTARVESSKEGANNLYLSVSGDGGKTFKAPLKVNDDQPPAVHGMHALEVDKNGHIYFAWLDERYLQNQSPLVSKPMDMSQMENNSGAMKHQHSEANREVYFAVSADGGLSFSPNKRIAENVCPCCKVSMAAAPDNRLYVSWRQVLEGDFRHIAVSSSIDGGNSFSPLTIVSNDQWQIAGCPVSGAAMTVDKSNNLEILWYTAGAAGPPGIYQSESQDGGRSFAPRKLLSDKGASGTPVIMPDAEGNSRIFFPAMDKNIYFVDPQNTSTDFQQNRIADAELPGAAISKDRTVVAFIRKINEKRNIFLWREDK